MGEALISRSSKQENINIVQETGTSTTDVMSQNASTNSFAAKIHSHSVSDLNSGVLSVLQGGTGQSSLNSGQILLGNGTNGITSIPTLPIDKGGTGATNAKSALNNLGVTFESGSWTPTLSAREGNKPTYSILYNFARYYRVNNLVYISFHLKANITNKGSGYACINGLPFSAGGSLEGQGLALREMYGAITNQNYSESCFVLDGSSSIYLQTFGGAYAAAWQTGDVWIGFSGCYIKL